MEREIWYKGIYICFTKIGSLKWYLMYTKSIKCCGLEVMNTYKNQRSIVVWHLFKFDMGFTVRVYDQKKEIVFEICSKSVQLQSKII